MIKEMKQTNIKINKARLLRNIEELGKIGMNSEGGIDRVLCSDADLEARNWLIEYWERTFLSKVKIDAIANMWLKKKGTESLPAIALGSHHDAVPSGGKYDGALGVLMATEIMETLQENEKKLRHPLSLVSFTGEEPNPYNVSTLGSKVASGKLKREDLEKYFHRDTKETLPDAIARMGGDISRVREAVLKKEDLAAFIECHIEQGEKLEKLNLSIATVTNITGIYREKITVTGEANHAGTTLMDNRKDAYLAAAEYSLAIEAIVKELQSDEVTATVGYVNVEPNEANIISGNTILIMDMRICDTDLKEEIIHKFDAAAAKIEKARKVSINREVILNQEHTPMDEKVMEALDTGAELIGEPYKQLISMAGHDAANMALLTRTGMIFLKSINGKSHCKEEYSEPEDIEKAANAMLQAVLLLDEELD